MRHLGKHWKDLLRTNNFFFFSQVDEILLTSFLFNSHRVINLLYERALRELPGSYKLWYRYLTVKMEQVSPL